MNDRKRGEENLKELLKERDKIDELMRDKFSRELTIMFTDIEGSTTYFESRGDINGLSMVFKHNELLFPVIERHQGNVIKTIGDSIMASFPEKKGKYIKEGKVYGVTRGLFRERWWNFYERGCSFASGEFWNEAISDFREALNQRNKDGYRARTYGMHFVDYFPHRELGIAYYHTGQYSEAVEELTASLSQVETAKAKYFLNKVRGEVLKKTEGDKKSPLITNLSLSDGETTNLFNVELNGVVEDDNFYPGYILYFNGSWRWCDGDDLYWKEYTFEEGDSVIVIFKDRNVENIIPIGFCTAEKIYGEDSEEVELLRYFRYNVLSKTPEGREIIRLYYE